MGPAGRVLDEVLGMAGIQRESVFTTNGVKHFKFRARGKRRIHQRPAAGELKACRQWLEAEIQCVRPEVVVALGASASYSLLGRSTPVGENRGRVLESPLVGVPVVVTTHPSSILRERDRDARHAALGALADDLRRAAGQIA